jgi:formylglycine-generating enzyme required for sulfatase activity
MACNKAEEPSEILRGPQDSIIRPPTGMVYIPPGEFERGSNPEEEPALAGLPEELKYGYKNESPKEKVTLKGFFIDRYEVTFMEYNIFLKATGRPYPEGWNNYDFSHSPDYPVFGVSWAEADAYARWAKKRLPTEAEWEKAARGTDGRRYVWGDEYGFADQLMDIRPVGTRLIDKSPYQVFDMAGNVAEWTANDFSPYSGSGYQDPQYGQGKKVVRGYFSPGKKDYPYADIYFRVSARYGMSSEAFLPRLGFRCAMDINTPDKNMSPEKAQKEEKEYSKEMVYIPPGPFVLGTDIEKEETVPDSFGLTLPAYLDETPQQMVYLDGFYIDRYEVRIEQFRDFLKAKNRPTPEIWDKIDRPKEELEKFPVFGITWAEAAEYAQWIGKRLPTEEEWEKAARGTDGIKFLWEENISGMNKNDLFKALVPVDQFTMLGSPYGVYGMTGNVSEWTESWYEPYPGNRYPNDNYGKKYKVVKGASYKETGHYNIPYFLRLACRGHVTPTMRYMNIGFRCAKDLYRVATHTDLD